MYGKFALMIVSLASLVAACGERRSTPDAAEPAEFVFLHGGVYTVDPAKRWAEAAAVRGGEIVYVGNDEGAKKFIGTKTTVANLRGKLMLPGLITTHDHATMLMALSSGLTMEFSQNSKIMLDTVREYLVANQDAPGFSHRGTARN